MDRIIYLGVGPTRIDNVTNAEAELVGLGHRRIDECIGNFVAMDVYVGVREETASYDGLLIWRLIFEHVYIEFEERRESLSMGIVGHLGSIQLLIQRGQDLRQLCLIHVRTDKGGNVETARTSYALKLLVDEINISLQCKLTPNFKVYKHMVVTVVVGQVMENAKALGEKLRVVGVSGVDV